jgi:hypothetical protein
MKIFSHVASRRNRRTIVAVFGVKKEIPVDYFRQTHRIFRDRDRNGNDRALCAGFGQCSTLQRQHLYGLLKPWRSL